MKLFDIKNSAIEEKKEALRIPLIVLLSVMVLAITIVADVIDYYMACQSHRWPAAKGVIMIIDAPWEIFGRETLYRPKVQYSYVVDGKTRLGARFSYQRDGLVDWTEMMRLTKKFPKDKQVNVLYNPDNPIESCLESRPRAIRLISHFVLYVLLAAIVYFSFYPIVPLENKQEEATDREEELTSNVI